jgi:DNA-binding transcriptional LysR family regulator
VIDFSRIQAFVAIVDEGGFQNAARALNKAQPWLSVQFKQLEEALGFELIYRSNRKTGGLTTQGELFLPHARNFLRAYDEMLAGARHINRIAGSELFLGADPFTLHVPERNILIARFMERHPEVRLRIVTGTSSELYSKMKDGQIDAMIATEPDRAQWDMTWLCCYRIALLVPAESKLAELTEISPELLADTGVWTVDYDYHPEIHVRLRHFMGAFGVELGSAPEPGYSAVLRYAQVHRKPVITVDFPPLFHEIPDEMVFRPLTAPSMRIDWFVTRPKHTEKLACRQLCDLASALAGLPD